MHQALNLLASKWLLLILLALMQRPKRNSELQGKSGAYRPRCFLRASGSSKRGGWCIAGFSPRCHPR
ncbi:MAG: hypothetical protein WKG07_02370 [Hymenobacter sp.]